MMQKSWKMTETLANGYSSESTQRELSNEYQYDRVLMIFKDFCVLGLLTNVGSALEGLTVTQSYLISARLPWMLIFIWSACMISQLWAQFEEKLLSSSGSTPFFQIFLRNRYIPKCAGTILYLVCNPSASGVHAWSETFNIFKHWI